MNDRFEPILLDDWIRIHSSEEELRSLFLNLDLALKYIHEHGYCVEVFYPSFIEILDQKPDHIRFRKLMELSKDSIRRREMIKEDIFHSSLIQIGIYSNSLKYLKPDFLRENFDSFVQFLPSDDVPYYRGVVQRGAGVYLSEYMEEKRNRDLHQMESQLDEGGNSNHRQLTKTNGKNVGIGPITNDKINDSIYRQINGLNDSAFVHALIIPTMVFLALFLFALLSFVISYFI